MEYYCTYTICLWCFLLKSYILNYSSPRSWISVAAPIFFTTYSSNLNSFPTNVPSGSCALHVELCSRVLDGAVNLSTSLTSVWGNRAGSGIYTWIIYMNEHRVQLRGQFRSVCYQSMCHKAKQLRTREWMEVWIINWPLPMSWLCSCHVFSWSRVRRTTASLLWSRASYGAAIQRRRCSFSSVCRLWQEHRHGKLFFLGGHARAGASLHIRQ